MSTVMKREPESASGSTVAERGERLRTYLARRDTPRARTSPGEVAKSLSTDVSELVKAEVALAKAEVALIAKEKALGVGLALGAAVLGWLIFQGLLITIGLALAHFMPDWVAAGIVTLVLLLVAGVLGFLGYKRLTAPANVEVTKASVDEDLAVAKDARARVGSR